MGRIYSEAPSAHPDPIATVERNRAGNLPLIAAAPDLLNALEQLYALVRGECPSLLEDDHHDTMVCAAIEKATGKQL